MMIGTLMGESPLNRKSGKCQMACSTPRIRLAASAERPINSRGKAKPRKPGSSPSEMKNTMKMSSKMRSSPDMNWGVAVTVAPEMMFSPNAASRNATGSSRAMAYHWMPTRQRTIRLK